MSASKFAATFLAALAFAVVFVGPAMAQWEFAIESDTAGIEYSKASVRDEAGISSIYTECTTDLGMGLAVILSANEEMIDKHGGLSGDILYMNEAGDEVLASVDYSPGDGVLTLITPHPQTIERAWELMATAEETITVRFTLPPFPQVFEVVFPADGAETALEQIRDYCA